MSVRQGKKRKTNFVGISTPTMTAKQRDAFIAMLKAERELTEQNAVSSLSEVPKLAWLNQFRRYLKGDTINVNENPGLIELKNIYGLTDRDLCSLLLFNNLEIIRRLKKRYVTDAYNSPEEYYYELAEWLEENPLPNTQITLPI